MASGGKPTAYKVRVTQAFDVYLYFKEGIDVEDDSERYDIIVEEALNAASRENGLSAVLHDETESHNGYLAYVAPVEPDVTVKYKLDSLPSIIADALYKEGIEIDE